MQPYFLPYIGYFQLIAAADVFVIYDDIKYTKKGWINRNRMLVNGKPATFTLPLKADSDFLDVRDRSLAGTFDRTRLLNQFRGAYGRAPHFQEIFPWLSGVIRHEETNLFAYIFNSIQEACSLLEIGTRLVRSSDVPLRDVHAGQDRVIATCKALGAREYLNPIGGVDLYGHEDFGAAGLELRFLRPGVQDYPQFGGAFTPALSIVDVLMFNSVAEARTQVRRHGGFV